MNGTMMATGNDNDGSIDRLTGDGTAPQHPFGVNDQRQQLYQPQHQQQQLIGLNGSQPIPFVLPSTNAASGLLSPTPMATFLPGSSMPSTSTQSILVPSVLDQPQSLQSVIGHTQSLPLALQPQQQPAINATGISNATTVDSSNLLAHATAQNHPPSPEVSIQLIIYSFMVEYSPILPAAFHSSLCAICMQ